MTNKTFVEQHKTSVLLRTDEAVRLVRPQKNGRFVRLVRRTDEESHGRNEAEADGRGGGTRRVIKLPWSCQYQFCLMYHDQHLLEIMIVDRHRLSFRCRENLFSLWPMVLGI